MGPRQAIRGVVPRLYRASVICPLDCANSTNPLRRKRLTPSSNITPLANSATRSLNPSSRQHRSALSCRCEGQPETVVVPEEA